MRGIYLTYFCNNPANAGLTVARELAPARVRSARTFLGPLRSPAGANSLATTARSDRKVGLAGEHRVGEEAEVQQIQAKMRGNRRA